MRSGLSTIQQTLTSEAAAVLTASIAEAGRRNHSQTTPLHVAATLLASPSGFLRQACIRSHPNSSHPLQCRALELCFSVALERLPATAPVVGVSESLPQPSNALMAALKRAQAHQRRGCPEQQQQPLLAVKVELEQLIISILDDPSVSRVMREASFSSPAVKAAIEQSISSQAHPSFRPSQTPPMNRSMYFNPRLQPGNSAQLGPTVNDEIKKISDIFSRPKKRNPILVGENEPMLVMNELRMKLDKGEFNELKNIEVIRLNNDLVSDKARLVDKIRELCALVEGKIANSGVILLDLCDLKWLVESQQSVGAEAGRTVVDEVAKVVTRFGNGRLWLIGTATCETYLRCQIYYPSMENDWDLQVVPIAPRSPSPGMFSRLGGSSVLSESVNSLSQTKTFQSMNAIPRPVPENLDPARPSSLCPRCTENYEKELAKLVADEYEKSSSEVRSEPARPSLPQWLQNAKSDCGNATSLDQSKTKEQEMVFNEKTKELQKKWSDMCLDLHPNFHSGLGSQAARPPMNLYNPRLNNLDSQAARPPMNLYNPRFNNLDSQEARPPMNLYNPKLNILDSQAARPPMNLYNPKLANLGSQTAQPPMTLYNPKLLQQPIQQKLQPNKALGVSLQLNSSLKINQRVEKLNSPPRSPVRTDLVLGRPKTTEPLLENTERDRVKNLLGCLSSEFQVEKFAKALDTDSYKKLLKALMEKVWWQKEAASAVASTVTKCKAGEGKRRGTLSKGDTWLLFTGPDRVGKKKMAYVISEQICGFNPTIISLGRRRSDEEIAMNFRGKTVLDRIVEAVKRNPNSVIMLEDIDEADIILHGNIKRAMESGRLADSYGREISLGNVIFILTANWLPDNFSKLGSVEVLDENKIESVSSSGWQLRLRVSEKKAKRRADWLLDGDRLVKPRRELSAGLSLDLNLMADFDDDLVDGSLNSSDLTADQDYDQIRRFSITSVPIELANFIDDVIVFKPVEIISFQIEIRNKIFEKFSSIVDDVSLEVEKEALEKILGGIWLGRTSLEEWGEKVLIPSFSQIKNILPSIMSSVENVVVRIEIDTDSGTRSTGECLPSSIRLGV